MNHKERCLPPFKCQPVDRIPHGETDASRCFNSKNTKGKNAEGRGKCFSAVDD